MFRNYLTVAWRNILRSKAHSSINIIGLGLGLACALLIMLYTSDDLSFDKFHSNARNIYRMGGNAISPTGEVEWQTGRSSLLVGPHFAQTVPEVEEYVRIDDNWFDIRVDDKMISQKIFSADKNFFSFFSFKLIRGNPKTALSDPYNLVLTENSAIKLFGTQDVLGKTILVAKGDKLETYTVTGLAKNAPENSSIQFEVIKPFTEAMDPANGQLEWINSAVNTFISVHPDTDLVNLLAKLTHEYSLVIVEAKKIAKAQGFEVNYVPALQPLTAIHLDEVMTPDGSGLERGGSSQSRQILMIIAVLILVIACINFINLAVARSAKRAKEIGVRKVIGGLRRQLVYQFLGESFMMCVASFASAILIALLLLPLSNEMVNKQLSIMYLLDFQLVIGFLCLLLVTGLFAGIYPALVMSSYSPIVVLTQRFKVGRVVLQKSLVIFQFGLATALTLGASTIYKQYDFLTSRDLGYDPDNIAVVGKSGLTKREVSLFRNELNSQPGIEAVSVYGGGGIPVKVNGDSTINTNCDYVDEGFVSTFRLKLIQGRNFSAAFPADTIKSIIVNETFVKEAGWSDPIGQVVKMFPFDGSENRAVIGVVKDWNNTPLTLAISPQALVPNAGPFKDGYAALVVRIAPNSEAHSLPLIESAFKKLFPLSTYEFEFQTDSNLSRYHSEARWKKIIFFASIVTGVISCIGLLGLTMITAERRLKELSIRKVLGATAHNIVVLLSASFIRLIVIAMTIAMPVAWYLGDRWLSKYPYRFNINWVMFVEVGSIVLAVALMTTVWQSLRAALHNPVHSLKE
jgi:putative ABC transport system permease protein